MTDKTKDIGPFEPILTPTECFLTPQATAASPFVAYMTRLMQDTRLLHPDDIARTVGLPKRQICQTLQTLTGATLGEFVLCFRMRQAAQLLRTTPLSTEAIAHRCGYANARVMARSFSRYYGVTMVEYRDRQR